MAQKKTVHNRGITARLMQYLEARDGTNVYLNEVAEYLQVHPSIAQSAINNLRGREPEKDGFYWRQAVYVITRGQAWNVKLDRGRPTKAAESEPVIAKMITLEKVGTLDDGTVLVKKPNSQTIFQLKPLT